MTGAGVGGRGSLEECTSWPVMVWAHCGLVVDSFWVQAALIVAVCCLVLDFIGIIGGFSIFFTKVSGCTAPSSPPRACMAWWWPSHD